MNPASSNIEEAGLRFFGRVTASVSHEIRNVLAIINENAGLLEDLAFGAEKGIPLETERVKTLSGKLKKHVLRGNEIVNNMNRFAHSVDERVVRVDLRDLVNLVVQLAQRTASAKKAVLEQTSPEMPVPLTTRPFLLENAVWLCLHAAIEAAAAPTITLAAQPDAGGALISITGLDEQALGARGPALVEGEAKMILDALGAEATVAPETGAVTLCIPDIVS